MNHCRVGFQGTSGAFSEQAMLRAVASPVTPVGHETAADVGRAIVDGSVEYGFLPLENTLAGTVTPSYEVLARCRFRIRAEVVMPIRHCLLGIRGTRVEDIADVRSHPVALAQCTHFFERHPAMRPAPAFDTAGAAAAVAAEGEPARAAIAPEACAERYGLEVLARGIEDRDDNQTRFVFLSDGDDRRRLDLKKPASSRGAIHAEIPNEPGSLARLLAAIAEEGHNLTKVEGRPGADPWSYQFILELEPRGPHGWAERLVARCQPLGDVHLLGVFPRLFVEG